MRLEFEFIQVAMGLRERLSAVPSVHEWQVLFEFCKRQSLLGVGFAAVEKLHEVGVECPSTIRLQWYGYALSIERMNEKLNIQCGGITKRYEHDGLRCCILKGQGNLLNYPESLRMRRTPGDIDLWCITPPSGLSMPNASLRDYTNYHGINAVLEYVRMQYRLKGTDIHPKACYHHIEAPDIDGTEVEVHYRAAFLRSPLRNWRMQRWFEHHADECMKNKTHLGFSMMTSSVNVVYQMCHLYTHVFEGGVGLRQLMDYYYTLKIWHNDLEEKKELESKGVLIEGHGSAVMSPSQVMSVFRSFGMAKFASAVMSVLHEVFAMPTHYYICEPNEKEGKRLLEEIMKGGNFGQYDTRDAALKKGGMMKHGVWKLKRVMRLVRSYPEEALWEPVFRVYHLIWRKIIDY